MSKSSRTLKSDELPLLEQARDKALELDYHLWIRWMRSKFNYSLSVRMCTFVGVKLPSKDFYDAIRVFNKEIAA